MLLEGLFYLPGLTHGGVSIQETGFAKLRSLLRKVLA